MFGNSNHFGASHIATYRGRQTLPTHEEKYSTTVANNTTTIQPQQALVQRLHFARWYSTR